MHQDKKQNEQMNESWCGNRGLHLNTTTLKIYVSKFDIKRTSSCASTEQNMIKKLKKT